MRKACISEKLHIRSCVRTASHRTALGCEGHRHDLVQERRSGCAYTRYMSPHLRRHGSRSTPCRAATCRSPVPCCMVVHYAKCNNCVVVPQVACWCCDLPAFSPPWMSALFESNARSWVVCLFSVVTPCRARYRRWPELRSKRPLVSCTGAQEAYRRLRSCSKWLWKLACDGCTRTVSLLRGLRCGPWLAATYREPVNSQCGVHAPFQNWPTDRGQVHRYREATECYGMRYGGWVLDLLRARVNLHD